MYFRILEDEATGLMSYLLADLDAGEAVVIDLRMPDVHLVEAMLAEHRLRLRAILVTHRHGGALADDPSLTDALRAPVLLGNRLADGALIDFGSEHVRVLVTAGHTDHCRSFLWRDRLFCGGLLSADACPHTPTVQQPQAMWDSVMHKVFTLPPETLLFSAHAGTAGAVSNVMTQRRRHPWLGARSRDEFLSLVSNSAFESSHP